MPERNQRFDFSLRSQRAPGDIIEARLRADFDLRDQSDLRAITLSPAAWAWAFMLWRDFNRGKDFENRQHDRFRFLLGNWICLHAGATLGQPGCMDAEVLLHVEGLARQDGCRAALLADDVPLRTIVAVGFFDELYPPVPAAHWTGSVWRFPNQWGMHLAEVVVLPEPVWVEKGMQGAWRIDGQLRQQVREGFRAARAERAGRVS